MKNDTLKSTADGVVSSVFRNFKIETTDRASRCLEIMAPDGLPVYSYKDALTALRVIESICLAIEMTLKPSCGGGNPWEDAAGYCLVRASEFRIQKKIERFNRLNMPDSGEAELVELTSILAELTSHFGGDSAEIEELKSAIRFVEFRRRNPPKGMDSAEQKEK